MDSRKQFEEWITTTGLEADLSRGNHGCYLNPPTHWLYCAWQASRKAITIELPTINNKEWACTSSECESMRHGITLTKHNIHAAGVRTK
jgi:hypothetical protein